MMPPFLRISATRWIRTTTIICLAFDADGDMEITLKDSAYVADGKYAEEIVRLLNGTEPAVLSGDPTIIDRKQLADLLSVSARTVDRLVDDGILPAPLLIGKDRRWLADEIETAIRKLPRQKPKQQEDE